MKPFLLRFLCAGVLCAALGAAQPARAADPSEVTPGLNTWQVGYEVYQVRSGDTVENIATRFGVDPSRIRAVNRLDASTGLIPGQSLAIVLPGRTRAPRAPEVAPEPAPAELQQLAPRYANVVGSCNVTSACPPNGGSVLWQCEAGDRVLVNAQQGDSYGVIMLGGSTGWIPAGAVTLTSDMVSASDLDRMLKGEGRVAVVQEAMAYLGTPYRLGGNLPRDVDCSLLVQTVFARHGIRLPRTAAAQCEVGRPVNVNELQPGDRLYFINRAGRIGHTAIYMGGSQFVHASSNRGCVAVDSLQSPYYASRFYGARRS